MYWWDSRDNRECKREESSTYCAGRRWNCIRSRLPHNVRSAAEVVIKVSLPEAQNTMHGPLLLFPTRPHLQPFQATIHQPHQKTHPKPASQQHGSRLLMDQVKEPSDISLLTLPTELRLQIYQYLPQLLPGRHDSVGPHLAPTPPICRVNRLLKSETLPLYAANTHFAIQADEDAYPEGDRVSLWLLALGDCVKHVQSFQLSRHWKFALPTRGQGHVGFYLRLQFEGGEWGCRAGTYPIAKDSRGLRAESVELLQSVLREKVVKVLMLRETKQLCTADVKLVATAMDIVATHPVSPFDTEQSEPGRQRRRKAWSEMERKLLALSGASHTASKRQF